MVPMFLTEVPEALLREDASSRGSAVPRVRQLNTGYSRDRSFTFRPPYTPKISGDIRRVGGYVGPTARLDAVETRKYYQ
jgi:hypothetical protein